MRQAVRAPANGIDRDGIETERGRWTEWAGSRSGSVFRTTRFTNVEHSSLPCLRTPLMTRTITAGRISTRRFAGTRSNTNIGAIRMIGGPSRLSSPVFRDAKISGRTLSRRQEQGKIQGNLDFEMESHALCLAGADFSGSLVRSLIKNNRESNFDNREVHSPRTGKNC